VARRAPLANALQRVLSYLLTGIDDEAIVSVEQSDIARAEANAKLTLISELLKPIEQRIQVGSPLGDSDQQSTISRADDAIDRLSSSLAEDRQERARLQRELSDAITAMQSAESQIIAIDELMARYQLLHKRYDSDLDRLIPA
jgi:septal ring factor EnvC (AmiA/AmiB activator)